MTTAERLARYEDIFGLLDNVVGEIIAGQLYTHPRPAPAHVRASSVLGNKVGTSFDQGEGGGPDHRTYRSRPQTAPLRRHRLGGLTMRLSPEQIAQIRQIAAERFHCETNR